MHGKIKLHLVSNPETEKIGITSLRSSRLRMANKYVTRDNMMLLFQILDPKLLDLDNDYDEIELPENNSAPILNPSHKYMVISVEEWEGKISTPKIVDDACVIAARKEFIQKHYVPLHPHLYQFSLDLFDDNFVRTIQEFDQTQDAEKLLSLLTKHTETGLYSFPLFKLTYCQQLLEELDFYLQTGLPVESPNSMNNYGLIIDSRYESSYNSNPGTIY